MKQASKVAIAISIVGAILSSVIFWGNIVLAKERENPEGTFFIIIIEQILLYFIMEYVVRRYQNYDKSMVVFFLSWLAFSFGEMIWFCEFVDDWMFLFYVLQIVIWFVILWIHIIHDAIRKRRR